MNKNDSSWLTSSESEAIRQELREAKEQRETSLVTIFCRSACIIGSLSLLLSLTSGRIDLVPYTVFNGVVFGGLIVGVVALVRKRRKGKG